MINKVVFHGNEQNEVNHDIVFFSTDKGFSNDYGNVEAYRLTLNNPFNTCKAKDISKLFDMVSVIVDDYDDSEYRSYEELDGSGLLGHDTWEVFEPYMREIKSLGYDGMIIYEGGIENYVAFSSDQYRLV